MTDLSRQQSNLGVTNKVALVTGASSGLGAHFARVLYQAGAKVVVAARRVDHLHELADELPGSVAVPVDLTQGHERERLIQKVRVQFGRIDILVNNAGITEPGRIETESLESFRAVLDLNLIALWHLCKLAGTQMLGQGAGSIVNIASIFGHRAAAPMAQSAYVASKSAVVGLTKELAVQWAADGIRVNALCPGFFLSEMTNDALTDDRNRQFIERQTPMGRIGQLAELDGPLLLLCSDAGSYLTGTSIIVDGGWTAR